jgi:hypothetical protein
MMSGGGRRVSRGGGREYGVVLVLMLEGGEARLWRMWFVGQTQRPPASATRRGRRGEASLLGARVHRCAKFFPAVVPSFLVAAWPHIAGHPLPLFSKCPETSPDHHHHTVQPGL